MAMVFGLLVVPVRPESISIIPQRIDPGEKVKIEINTARDMHSLKVKISSPQKREYFLDWEKTGDHQYVAFFAETFDKGFLTENWNQYVVQLCAMDDSLIIQESFFLKDKHKTLYFTLYIDDFGAGGIPQEEDIEWYHDIGGPLNYGFQCDDIGCVPLKKILKKYGGGRDFIFHHFHSYEFVGSRHLKRIDALLDWYKWHHKLNGLALRLTNNRVRFRDRHLFGLLVLSALVWIAVYLKRRNSLAKFAALLSLGLFFLFLVASQAANHKHSDKNMRIRIDDLDWCQDFLKKTKTAFENNGLNYPRVTRHGWNLPPAKLNEFYLKEMNVLADASAIYGSNNSYFPENSLARRTIRWRDTVLPYYTDIHDDFNSLWDGQEENRGILEIPLAFDNIVAYGFSDADRQLVGTLPNGALISTYIHPANSIKSLKSLLDFLKKNFEVRFVSVAEYLDIYMSYFPRPVLINLDTGKSYWSLQENGELRTICETEIVNLKAANNGSYVKVKTKNAVPIMGLTSEGYAIINFDDNMMIGEKTKNGYNYIIKNVDPGEHVVKFIEKRER
jgi:hypothetical protein